MRVRLPTRNAERGTRNEPVLCAPHSAHCVLRWARRWLAWLLVLIGLSAYPAEPPRYAENQVKSAFLAKFAMFVEWPAQTFPTATAPVVIGILGDDPFGPQFESALLKESVNGRAFVLKRFKEPGDLTPCQILFVSASERSRLPEIFAATRRTPMLTVGDQERFAHQGGMINLVVEGGKVRFEVNTAAVETSGLKLSAKLLQVARPVVAEPAKGGG